MTQGSQGGGLHAHHWSSCFALAVIALGEAVRALLPAAPPTLAPPR